MSATQEWTTVTKKRRARRATKANGAQLGRLDNDSVDANRIQELLQVRSSRLCGQRAWLEPVLDACSGAVDSLLARTNKATMTTSECSSSSSSSSSSPSSSSSWLDIVCFGIGSPQCSVRAQYQFALIIAVAEHLGFDAVNALHHFDPVVGTDEADALAEAIGRLWPGLVVRHVDVNEQCARLADTPTLFFMPHCGRELYENLVRANSEHGTLDRLVLVGNAFSIYEEALVDADERRAIANVLAAAPLAQVQPFAGRFEPLDVAFTDMCIQSWSICTLQGK
jgi:SRR1 domain